MERDALVSHGASSVVRDRMFEQSDYYTVPVCKTCGLFCIPKSSTKFGASLYQTHARCPRCKTSEIQTVEIPYATKLCIQELEALHIGCRLRV